MANNFLNEVLQSWVLSENPQMAQDVYKRRALDYKKIEDAQNAAALAESLQPLVDSTKDPQQRALLENAIATGRIPNEDALRSSLALRNIVAGSQSKNTEIPAAIKEVQAYQDMLGISPGTKNSKQFVQDFIFKTSPLDKSKYEHDVADDAEGRKLQRLQMAVSAAQTIANNEVKRANRSTQVKLKPGERLKPDGTAESVPGSDLYRKQNEDFANDYNANMTVNNYSDNMLEKILGKKGEDGEYTDGILSPDNADAFKYNFGWKEANITRELPQAKAVTVKVDTIKENLKRIGFEMMRQTGSIGSMTEREWPIVEKQLESITADMGEEEARRALSNVAERLQRIKDQAKIVFETKWKDTPFYKRTFSDQPVRVIKRGGKTYKQMSNDPNDWVAE